MVELSSPQLSWFSIPWRYKEVDAKRMGGLLLSETRNAGVETACEWEFPINGRD